MSRARYRDDGAGPGMKRAGSRAVGVMALVSLVGLSAVACGNRSSSDKLNALLNGNNSSQGAGAPAATPATPAAPADSSAGAAGSDPGSSAATPGVGAAAGASGSSTGGPGR
ncbi:MAG: hypothetical protein QOI86_2555, partial [Actinomycetota bacterium]|nr:hypothetical protein [Actinomycetota bacterium]